MGVHFLATVAQVTRAIATSEPCAFDGSHASIANSSCMDEGREERCSKFMMKIRKEIPRNQKKKNNITFGIIDSIWRRASWKNIATAVFRTSEITNEELVLHAYRGGNRICDDSKGLSTGLGSLKKT